MCNNESQNLLEFTHITIRAYEATSSFNVIYDFWFTLFFQLRNVNYIISPYLILDKEENIPCAFIDIME